MSSIMSIWGWEMAAMVSSIACLAATVALLAVYDNHQVFQFYGITLNAVIAFLSTLGKTTLLFVLASTIGQRKWILFSNRPHPIIDAYIIDEASRGPLGSAHMIWRMRRSILATIGAICTVLALASDPFTQQLIQYQNLVVGDEQGFASIPRAQRFSKGLGDTTPFLTGAISNLTAAWENNTYSEKSGAQGEGLIADASIQAGLLYGLTHDRERVTRQTAFTCTTGNCLFNPFRSLAVCNRCASVANLFNTSMDDQPMSNVVVDGGDALVNGNSTRFSLPNGAYIANLDTCTSQADTAVAMATLGTGNTSNTITMQDLDTLIYSITMIKWLNTSEVGQDQWPNVQLEATECALYYCVKEYVSSVINGTLYENVTIDSDATRSPGSWQYEPNQNSHSFWTGPTPATIQYDPILARFPHTDLSLGSDFNVSQAAVDSISLYFRNFFGGVYAPNKHPRNLDGWYMSDSANLNFYPSVMQALYLSSNLTETFENVAFSLSNAFRAEADNDTVEVGVATKTELKFLIVWPWISLNILLVALGFWDLVSTIVQTARGRVRPWKSHLLAALAWGRQIDDLSGVQTTDKMEKLGRSQTIEVNPFVPKKDAKATLPRHYQPSVPASSSFRSLIPKTNGPEVSVTTYHWNTNISPGSYDSRNNLSSQNLNSPNTSLQNLSPYYQSHRT